MRPEGWVGGSVGDCERGMRLGEWDYLGWWSWRGWGLDQEALKTKVEENESEEENGCIAEWGGRTG